jgi:hypothetical protein
VPSLRDSEFVAYVFPALTCRAVMFRAGGRWGAGELKFQHINGLGLMFRINIPALTCRAFMFRACGAGARVNRDSR